MSGWSWKQPWVRREKMTRTGRRREAEEEGERRKGRGERGEEVGRGGGGRRRERRRGETRTGEEERRGNVYSITERCAEQRTVTVSECESDSVGSEGEQSVTVTGRVC
jgi:hypothetical protein